MNEHETIADIVAEKRRRADEIERDCAEKMKRGEMTSDQYARELVADIRREADRLEAANRREVATTKESLAVGNSGDSAKLREVISTLRTALKEIRDDVLDMVMNYKSEDPDSYAHGLCLSIGGACDMALNSTKEFDNADK